MSEPTTPLPESPFCRVRARVASIWADGPDAGTSPDWRPAAGEKVTLTPSIGSQLLTYDVGGPEPIIVTVERVECVVDEDGWLAKSDGRPVYIAPTDDPLMSATGWTWTATIKGKSIAFSAPAGGVVDLALFIAAPATDNTRLWVERIPELVATIDGAGTAAVDAAAEAEQARDLTLGYRDTAAGHAATATTQAGLATTARTGAEAALAATLAASTIVGVGRPDIPATLTTPDTAALVAAATSGTVFRSTDGPQGAWEWRKRGTEWVCVEGYTGWRQLPVDTPEHPGLTLFAQRTHDTLWVRVGEASPSTDGAGLTLLYTLPFTWQADMGASAPMVDNNGTPIAGASIFLDSSSRRIIYIRKSGAARHLGQFSIPCARSWPTTLPGTAA